ncbi:MAG: ABC transporter permease [Planctomycetes bacterium]|nr:ABC transporter permease [Planctomycetota bacterium]
MGRYLIKRLLQAPLVLFVLVTISFFLMRAAPGGPFTRERSGDARSEQARAQRWGLDKPLPTQYLLFLGRLARGDLDYSMKQEDERVSERIARHLPVSLLLGSLALGLALLLGISAGVIAAMRRNRLPDHLAMLVAMIGLAVPAFVIGPLLAWGFGLRLGWLPVAGYDGWLHLVLPAVTLALPYAARIARLCRAGMLDVINQDFVRTARAKGLSELAVVARHVLRGGLLPVVSYLGPAATDVLTGSLVVEAIFRIPGMGYEFVNGALNRDYTVVMGTVVVYGALLVAFNLLSDLVYGLLDPRVRHA